MREKLDQANVVLGEDSESVIGENGKASPVQGGGVILVGVKLSSECREMLTWIITKLAQPGDQVIAVHVVRTFSDTDDVLDSSVKRRLDSTFESVLGVYQSICNLKQVQLDIKVVSGSCLRKSLVESAKVERASVLVLGGAKNGCSESLAKYCLRRLSSSCLVLVAEQGHIVFAKEGAQPVTGRTAIGTSTPERQPRYGQSKSDRALNHHQSHHREQARAESSAAGWPLMHRSISLEKAAPPSRSLSVVKWALQLPDRLKEAFDRQGGNLVRALASSAMQDQLRHESFPRLTYLTSGKNGLNNNVEKLTEGDETESHRTSVCSLTPESLAIQPYLPSPFLRKVDELCRNKSCARFRYEELREATSNFSDGKMVGKGGCSKVYRGTLSGGHLVAVKVFKQGPSEVNEELLTELEILSSLNHPNVVGLMGYSVDGDTHILVYNYATEGNLEDNLQGAKGKRLLSWSARHKIAVGAAQAFVYLHDICPRPVVHRDVKSSNILLTSSFRPQVSDFGLAKWAPTSTTHITCSDVVGTLGYFAPEYFMFGRVNDKTDVYSFGVVLLELITGRPPIDMSKPKGQENLVAWARCHLDSGAIDKLVDPRLEGNYDEKQLRHMAVAAKFCLRQSPQYRPRMTRVLRLLCGEDCSSPSGRYDFVDDSFGEERSESESNDVRKHLALAMMGVDDDVASQSSAEQNSFDMMQNEKNMDEYFGGRYSRSSSFD